MSLSMQMNCRAAPTPAILLLLLTHAHDTSALRLAVRPKLWLLDRDGCINADVGSPGVVRREDLHLIPGSAGAITRLRLFAPVAVVTNQSARGKGLLSAAGLDEIHERLRHLIASAARGGLASEDGSRWDGLYVCEDALPSSRKKPAAGMLLEAQRRSSVCRARLRTPSLTRLGLCRRCTTLRASRARQ